MIKSVFVSPSDSTNLTLDPNTANSYLILSEGNKKATCGDWQYYSYHLDRFDGVTQVLCKEGLTGRHYWEAEWSDGFKNSVYVNVAYKGIKRKGSGKEVEFGTNAISWSFGKVDTHRLRAWHNGLIYEAPVPSDDCSRVGVYLDCPGGTLSFYRVSSNSLTHLYTFENKFTGPVYPGIWAYHYGNYVYFNPTEKKEWWRLVRFSACPQGYVLKFKVEMRILHLIWVQRCLTNWKTAFKLRRNRIIDGVKKWLQSVLNFLLKLICAAAPLSNLVYHRCFFPMCNFLP